MTDCLILTMSYWWFNANREVSLAVCRMWSKTPNCICLRVKRALFRFLMANFLSMRESGRVRDVRWCLDNLFNMFLSQHQFSNIYEGSSTKSLSTLVPENLAKAASEQMLCITWPNSWKKVSTSSKLIRESYSALLALLKLHTIAHTGSII